MSMSRPTSEEVDQILLNAQLRDQLDPFHDESIRLLDDRRLPTEDENEFLASMLAWERAPVLPISEWFEPELQLQHPDSLNEQQLSDALEDTLQLLYDRRILLEFTDHLSDRELYCVIYRDIMPANEKMIDLPKNYLHWHCLDAEEDPHTWLRFYATPRERQHWADQAGEDPPPAESPAYPRRFRGRPRG